MIDSRKNRIICAGRKLILEKGYSNATLDMIVAQAGCSKSAVYQYFKSKEDLLMVIFDEVITELRNQLKDDQSSASVEEQLLNYVKINMSMTHSVQHVALITTVFSSLNQSPDLGKHYMEIGPQKAIDDLAVFFEEKTKQGQLNVKNTALAARHFLGSFHWWWYFTQMLSDVSAPSKEEMDVEAELLVGNFIKVYAPNE